MAKHRTPAPRAQRGETLVEVLVALLIVALATLLLASMVMVSARINITARQKDQAFYDALQAVETASAPTGSGHIKIEQKEPATGSVMPPVEVDVYAAGSLAFYKQNP